MTQLGSVVSVMSVISFTAFDGRRVAGRKALRRPVQCADRVAMTQQPTTTATRSGARLASLLERSGGAALQSRPPPLPIRDDGCIGKGVEGMSVLLQRHNHACSVLLALPDEDRMDPGSKVFDLFSDTDIQI